MLRFGNKKVFLFVLIIILLVSIAFSLLAYFDVLYHVNTVKRMANAFCLFDIGLYRGKPEKDFKLRREDGLEIAASLYGTEGKGLKPAIILLHGATNLGRKLPFYKVLSSKLAERGYIVLSLDFAGYGESGDPFQFNKLEALDQAKDVSTAIDYLRSDMSVDKDKIYIMGHSRGTGAALVCGIVSRDIRKIVIIGPPKPGYESKFMSGERERRKVLYNKDLPEWFTIEVGEKINSQKFLHNYTDYFSQEGHKPLFLVDGELNLQNANDKAFLNNFYTKIKDPKKLIVIRNSDHYSNVFKYKGTVFYNKRVVHDIVKEIDLFLRED